MIRLMMLIDVISRYPPRRDAASNAPPNEGWILSALAGRELLRFLQLFLLLFLLLMLLLLQCSNTSCSLLP